MIKIKNILLEKAKKGECNIVENNIAVIGGDLRMVKLVEMLACDNYKVNTYALERAESIHHITNVNICESLEEAIENIEVIVGPIPLSANNIQINTPFSEKIVTLEELKKSLTGKKFIAGNMKAELIEEMQEKNIEVIDLLKREELVVLNTISTAEGAIQIAMEETIKTIYGSKILVLGYGKVGKILANMLKGIGAEVYCEARKNVDLAWIKAYGYNPVHLIELEEYLPKMDIIINTIPSLILDKERLKIVNKESIIIDLASNPGGVDKLEAKKAGIKTIWALSLPGKVAPLTSAEFIKDTIYNVLKEI